MTVANSFSATNYTTQTWPNWQAGIDNGLAALAVVAGQFQPTVDGATLKVYVGAGAVITATGITAVAAQSVTLSPAPASPNSRIDLVVVDRLSGVASVTAGTAGTTPTAPACPAGKLPVCQITVGSGVTALTNSAGVDLRTTWCAALGTAGFATLGTGSGQVPTSDQVPGLVGPIVDAVARQDNLMLFLMTSKALALNAGGMVNGTFDAFNTDTLSGVSGTTGQTYVSASKLYRNGASGSVQISQSSGTAVGNLTNGGGLAAAFDGNTSQTDANSAYVGSYVSAGIIGKIYGTAQAVTGYNAWSATNDYGFQGGGGSVTTTIQLQGSNNSTTGLDGTWTTLDTTTVNTSGVGQQTVSRSGVLPGASSYTGLRLYITSSANGGMETFDVCELQFFALQPPNAMTLVTPAVTAATSPVSVQIQVLWLDLSGSAVLNTDLAASVTENGGTGWTAVTLTDTGDTVSGFHVLTGTASLAGSGTSVQMKLVTSAKSQQIAGTAMMWR